MVLGKITLLVIGWVADDFLSSMPAAHPILLLVSNGLRYHIYFGSDLLL